jgi:hypothetical protein
MDGFVGRKTSRPEKGKFWKIVIFLICASIIAYEYIHLKNNSAQKKEANKAITEIQKQFARFFKSSTDAKGFPKPIEERFDNAPQAKGDFGEMEKFTKELLNGMAEQRNGYLADLKAIGWEGILDARRIKSDVGLVESRTIIQNAKDTIATYQIKDDIFLKEQKRKIRTLEVSEHMKEQFAIGFDQGLKQSQKKVDEMWDLERKIVGEYENIINLLSTRYGAWVIEGDKIIFNNRSDLEKYNSFISAIQELSEHQTRIQKKNVDELNRHFNRLKT